MQTLNDFRNDLRKSAEPRKGNTNVMIADRQGDDRPRRSRQAAEYFGAMKWTPWIKVVETKTVPKTRVAGGMYLRLEGNETEPIGMRIIETPEITERTEVLRDPRSGFIAYVPVGSVKKGEALVMTGGNGRTVACGVCHGADLQGSARCPGWPAVRRATSCGRCTTCRPGARNGEWIDVDEAGRRQADRRGLRQHRGVYRFASGCSGDSNAVITGKWEVRSSNC